MEFFFIKMIESVEVDIGKELAGEITVGESSATHGWGNQSIAREIVDDGFLLIAAVDNGLDQPEGVSTFELATNQIFEDVKINRWKIFADVAL